MAIPDCQGINCPTGNQVSWNTGYESSSGLVQSRDTTQSFLLGGTEIVVNKQTRSFNLSTYHKEELQDGAFLILDSENDHVLCSPGTDHTNSNSVSEDYESFNTIAHFIDTRHNNGVFTEIRERVTFSKSGADMAGFKDSWGVTYYPKFVITNHMIERTTTYFAVLSGVKRVLKTVQETIDRHSADNPLILVYPNPPSLAIPWINCEDINQYGFYDYHEVGGNRIQEDGGDDFYWPEWCREVGTRNADKNAALAAERYLTYYLNAPDPRKEAIANPGIFTDSTPCASIAVDQAGRVFYSMTLGGQNFNYLTDGDLLQLFPYFPANPKFYPVGLI